MPSVRGRERFVVGSVLLVAAGGTGALAGFAAGIVGGVLGSAAGPAASTAIAAGLVLGASVLDAFVAAPSVGRQVPRAWGRLLGAPVAALLYGARLGVGPLTILSTWLWWAAWAAGALAGPLWSAAVGAIFGGGRVVAMLIAGTRAGSWAWARRPAAVAVGLLVAGTGVTAAATAVESVPGRGAAAAETPTTLAAVDTTTTPPDLPAAAPPSPGIPELLPAELPGFERIPDSAAARLGPLDLAAAAGAEADAAAELALLRTRGFAGGHARAWRTAEGVTAYAAVYRFGSADDAALYLEDGLVALGGRDVQARPSGRIDGAVAFTQADADERGSVVSHGLVFVRGDRFVLVIASGRNDASSPAPAIALADLIVPRLERSTGEQG